MDVNQLTKITIAWELYRSGIPKSHIAAQLGVHRETVHLWVTNVGKVDLVAYLE